METESFEEKYLDVLQNIEAAIVGVYRENAGLLDYDVTKALDALQAEYRAEQQGRTKSPPSFSANQQLVYDRVKLMCEWRLGRRSLQAKRHGKMIDISPEALTLDAILACLKRICKSIKLWTKEGGRQGYLHFIDNNIGM